MRRAEFWAFFFFVFFISALAWLFGQLLLLLTRKDSIVPNRYGACPKVFFFGC